ncbi:MAG: SAM-dependent chlorinase/fluorinase [Actinobacteria bacterium]|nr:SAM-dependent chlorinase/fluorinase [Actinomycetota bacterium]
MSKIITFTTDFGYKDEYVASVKAAIQSYSTDIMIVDISHEITPFSVLEGAFILASAAPHFKKAVHLAVVDPQVGSQRTPLILKTKFGHFLVGPDNGLLIPATERLGGIAQAFKIIPDRFVAWKISKTFHGRDIFAPASAMLAMGLAPEEIAEPIDEKCLTASPFKVEFSKNSLKCLVANVDRFGSLRLGVSFDDISRNYGKPKQIKLKAGKVEKELSFGEYFSQFGKGELFFYEDSSGYIAISANLESADKILGLSLGEEVELEFLEVE